MGADYAFQQESQNGHYLGKYLNTHLSFGIQLEHINHSDFHKAPSNM